MAKKFTHSVCGRSFRTQNGLDTHVLCTPVNSPTQATPVSESEAAAIREIKAELAAEYIQAGVAPVRAKIRANREVREALATA